LLPAFIFSCLVILNLVLGLEAFNVTNTLRLGAPNAVLASPGFCSITSAGDPRVIQLGIKLNF